MEEKKKLFLDDLSAELMSLLVPSELMFDVCRVKDIYQSGEEESPAVRVTHIPSGYQEESEEYSSQIENKIMALIRLKKKLQKGKI